MKNDGPFTKLRELSWRRKLTETEQADLHAQLAADAGARDDWAMESALNTALDRLPDAPVPSNFTARVMQAVEREAARPRAGSWSWNWQVLVPRIAVAVMVVGFAGLVYQRHESAKRTELARDITLLAKAQPLPGVEALKNFDAIQRMSQTSTPADDELLALLK